ncbi:MAG TPA: glycosyltransferase [Ferruginibacter sp.]|nr:glycosyltransferase [Ferruginibacter sp.]
MLGSAYPLRGGGITSFNERLALQFQEEGHDVTIWSFSLQYPSLFFPGKSQVDKTRPAPAIRVKPVINSINPFNWIITGYKLKKENPDIIVVRYWLPFMGPCLGTILRIGGKNSAKICIADNIIPHEKRPGDTLFTKYFIPPVDAFITMSNKVLNDLRIIAPGKKAAYVPHPLYDNFGKIISREEARKFLDIPREGTILLFFGFIRKYKGLDILLDAMKILKDTYQQMGKVLPKLLVAGEFYDDRRTYDEQVKKLGIEDMLIMKTKFIPDDQVKYYVCSADVVIQPYRNATQSGVTPLAYHFEIPMIVTNVGGLPDMVPPGAGLVAAPDPASIAEKISEFIQQGSQHFIPMLKEEKKKYIWEVLTQKIIELGER